MAEKKQEMSALDSVMDYLGFGEEKPKPKWEKSYKDEVIDHAKTRLQHRKEKQGRDSKRKKDAITRLKREKANQSKVKPKKTQNVLIKPKPKKVKKDYSKSPMSERQIGKNNFDALINLYDVLDGKGPTALDIASNKKVAEDKVTAGLAATDAPSGFDFAPEKDLGGLGLEESRGDPDYEAMRLKQREAAEYLEKGDSTSLVNQAAAEAGIDMDDERLKEAETALGSGDLHEKAQQIKESKPDKEKWYESEKFLVALAGLVPVVAGYALGGYEGALHGAKGTADAAVAYGEMEFEKEKLASKGATGKRPIIMVTDPKDPTKQISVYADPKTMLALKDANGNYFESPDIAKSTLAGGQKLEQIKEQGKIKGSIEAIRGKLRMESEALKGQNRLELQSAISAAKTEMQLLDLREKMNRLLTTESGKGARLDKKLEVRREAIRASLSAIDKRAEAQARNRLGKRATASQYRAAGFAARIEMAESDFVSLDKMGFKRQNWHSGLSALGPEMWKSEGLKLQEQAERNFINAVLRVESGAVISEGEFRNAEKQYLPRIGDTPKVLAQKKRNRFAKFDVMQREGGKAFKSLAPKTGKAKPKAAKSAAPQRFPVKKQLPVGKTFKKNGKTWKVIEDGFTVEEVL